MGVSKQEDIKNINMNKQSWGKVLKIDIYLILAYWKNCHNLIHVNIWHIYPISIYRECVQHTKVDETGVHSEKCYKKALEH